MFCTNCYDVQGPYAACKGAWCGACYKPLGNLPFPIKVQLDDEGELLDAGEQDRFLHGRAGDHLMTRFSVKSVISEM